MRKINLANEKKRNAEVGFELNRKKSAIHYRTRNGESGSGCRLLKFTLKNEPEALQKTYPDLTEALIAGDPEVDLEHAGRKLEDLTKIYLDVNGKAARSVSLTENLYAADGSLKTSRPFQETLSNIALESVPVRWTGKMFPRAEALRRFVFIRSYQLRHVNGLTFDFLYDMAKKLFEADSMLLLGAGEKGKAPLVMSANGSGYRAFLEGRIEGDRYALIMRLTNLELKEIIKHD